MSGFLGTIERVGNMVPHPAIIFTVLTEPFVEPRPGRYRSGLAVEASHGLSGSEQQGLENAGRALLVFVAAGSLLTVPPMPWGILHNQDTGIMAAWRVMSALIVLISLLFLVKGYAYGRDAGTWTAFDLPLGPR
ncbi:AbgT family transporter [Cereibacter sphaeroides]|uniref:AbgT family transporter n=1 Tax=Cereibacter sphaeroides TaxID=1063 RepID=UPI001F2B53F8|nr:AbgT family transporter [Cereibacter sphaeroides]MCE6951286.1 AbgT family transporter [Cereibacter sphaeroides]